MSDEATNEIPEWKKAAQAMKAAADETGCDFMTSPLPVIVDTLLLASGEQVAPQIPAPKDCVTCGERLPLNPAAFNMRWVGSQIVGWHGGCAEPDAGPDDGPQRLASEGPYASADPKDGNNPA